jgi:hypothetical protein
MGRQWIRKGHSNIYKRKGQKQMKNKGALFIPRSYMAPVSIKLKNVAAHQIHLKKT